MYSLALLACEGRIWIKRTINVSYGHSTLHPEVANYDDTNINKSLWLLEPRACLWHGLPLNPYILHIRVVEKTNQWIALWVSGSPSVCACLVQEQHMLDVRGSTDH